MIRRNARPTTCLMLLREPRQDRGTHVPQQKGARSPRDGMIAACISTASLGERNETSPPSTSTSDRGHCGASGRVTIRAGAGLSGPAGSIDGWVSRWRPSRHHRAPDRSMALGSTRPTIRYREPTGCWQQHRYRSSSARAIGRIYASLGHFVERD